MGLIQNVLLLIAVVVILYLVYTYFSGKKGHLTNIQSGTQLTTLKASTLPINNSSSNYAYSMWFNVNNWQYRLSDEKVLLSRTSNNQEFNPRITLAPYENNIHVYVSTYPESSNIPGSSNANENTHDCIIRNVPLQKWVNLIVSLNNRTLDIYLDGKLVRTCVLPGVPRLDPDADIKITPNNGFSGWTSNLQYFANPLNPQEAYNIYKKGYSAFTFGSLFEKYRIKVSYLVDNIEEGSLVI